MYSVYVTAMGEIEDHSQIARFVSSFIANGFDGKVRAGMAMGVVLHSYAVAGQQKMRLCNGIGE